MCIPVPAILLQLLLCDQKFLPTMAATAPVATAFPKFSSLAAELRNRIWREALPEEMDSALVPYRKGSWEHFIDDNNGATYWARFRSDWLETVRYGFGMAFVNREAHSIARAWFRQQKRFTVRLRQGPGSYARTLPGSGYVRGLCRR
jgi:hypothetical protein